MKDSKLVQQVKNKLGIEVDRQIRKEIAKEASPYADGYQLGRLYEVKAKRLLERKRSN